MIDINTGRPITPQDAALLASLTGFTPGPWTWTEDHGDPGLSCLFSGEKPVLEYRGNGWPHSVATPEDYALIAAAPDLHRIATEQAVEIERLRDVCNDLAAVIAYIDAHVPLADKSCVVPGATFSECARAARDAGQ